MLEIRGFIDNITKRTNVPKSEVIKEAIGILNKKEALEISKLAVSIWHETSCSIEEAEIIAKDLYREGYRYEML